MKALPVNIGDEFGRLTVESAAGRDAKGQVLWNCRCGCGAVRVVASTRLHQGSVASCGCLRREQAAATGRRHARHGEAGKKNVSAEYRAWAAMIYRCENPAARGHKSYGGRGIKVCERWRESYENFLTDMGRRPTYRHSIDRIDVNGNYEPGNCRWATPKQQGSNKRNNRWVTINGETKHLAEWARVTGIAYYTLEKRIRLWPESDWLLPVAPRHRRS